MRSHPSTWPVQPRQWTLVGGQVAAMMPYPLRDPKQASCLDNPMFTEDVQFTTLGGDTGIGKLMRKICTDCPIQQACAEYGIAHEKYLMLGGLTPKERQEVRDKRGQLLVEPHEAYKFGLTDEYLSSAVRVPKDSDAA